MYTWLVDHDPSRVDVAGSLPASAREFVPDGTIRSVSPDAKAACAQARRDRALLLVFVPHGDERRRTAVLDCGFAVERDAAALVIAPE